MIIATRVLKLRRETFSIEIPIRIHSPEQNGEDWICRFEIEWPEGKAVRWGTGVDAIQSILFAFQMIGAEIYGSDHHNSRMLSWLAPGKGYGFPVPGNIRDLLIGDDKRFL